MEKVSKCHFYAGVYGELPPDCSNKDVFLVDFSYNLDVLEQISNVARSVIILDHHKTAVENITLSKKNWWSPSNRCI